MFKRLIITICNILFPPVAVMLLTGPNEDLFINCIFFLLAVIPSHIHGFYVSLTYFNRKRKVRKGVYPGKRRGFIYSDKVQNGGASRREIERLRLEMETGRKEGEQGRASRVVSRIVSGTVERGNVGTTPNQVEDWDNGHAYYGSDLSRSSTIRSGRSNRRSRRPNEMEQVSTRRLSGRRAY